MFWTKLLIILSFLQSPSLLQTENQILNQLKDTYWVYEKSVILGLPYGAEKSEQNDGLHLKENLKYHQVEDGVHEDGIWYYDHQKKALVLSNTIKGEVLYLYIEKIDQEQFVYKIEEPWKFDVYIHLKKSPLVKKQS